jgi:hypothetical protein
MYQGVLVDMTWSAGALEMLMVFVKGFLFGFVLALIYDCIARCCKGRCCRKGDGAKCNCVGTCTCGCAK